MVPRKFVVAFEPVPHHLSDRDHLERVLLAEGDEIGHPSHVASSRRISQITPEACNPARRARSTAASVWPRRSGHRRRGNEAGKRARAGQSPRDCPSPRFGV